MEVNNNGRKIEPFNVCLFGCSLDTGNNGVSALTASLVKLIISACPDGNINLLIGNKSSKSQYLNLSSRKIELKVVNYRLSPRARLQEHLLVIVLSALIYRLFPFKPVRSAILKSNNWLKTLFTADFIGDVRGGDSFSDIYGIKRLIIGSLPCITALLLNKEYILLPQTYGPYKSFLAKRIARYVIKNAKRTYSRDLESIEIIEEMHINNSPETPIQVCPDVAFIMDSMQPDAGVIEPEIHLKKSDTLIGLNVSGLLYNGGYTRDNMFGLNFDYKAFILKLIDRLVNTLHCHLLLVPHVFLPKGYIDDDWEACKEILRITDKKCGGRIHIVGKPLDQYEIKGIIKPCDFFIGSRMHSCIAALSQGIVTAGVAYSRKFIGVFNTADLGNMVIDARDHTMNSAISKILMLYKNRVKNRVVINEKVKKIRMKIERVFRQLLDEYKVSNS